MELMVGDDSFPRQLSASLGGASVITIGRDGGGNQFVLALDGEPAVYRWFHEAGADPEEWEFGGYEPFEQVSPNLLGFLERMNSDWREFVHGNDSWPYMVSSTCPTPRIHLRPMSHNEQVLLRVIRRLRVRLEAATDDGEVREITADLRDFISTTQTVDDLTEPAWVPGAMTRRTPAQLREARDQESTNARGKGGDQDWSDVI